jgi:exopolysaccharide biosynthesis predicted pyruvyltransferase EpsI/nitroreductase
LNKLFLVGVFSPELPSVGDHAQLYALEKFLAEKFSDYEVVTFCRDDKNLFTKLAFQVQKDDLIFISSSGDFGDKYAYTGWHDTRKKIIDSFRGNRVIQLPVSVCYLSPANFELDKSFFCNMPHFTLLCRTVESADLLRANFSCDVRFFPDFVFSLKSPVKNKSRVGGLIVLRDDAESYRTPPSSVYRLMVKLNAWGFVGHGINRVLKRLNYLGDVDVSKMVRKCCGSVLRKDVMVSNTVLSDDVRAQAITDLFRLFSGFKLVVTDRFHAAVFAQLTGTPCVALPTGIKTKISGCNNLLPMTLCINSDKNLQSAIKEALTMNVKTVDYSPFFDGFRDDIVFNIKPLGVSVKSCANLLDVIKQRRSIRKFTGGPVDHRLIDSVIEAGVYAPSAANMQATRFKVVTDYKLIRKICVQCSPWLAHCTPSFIVAVCYDLSKPNKIGLDHKVWGYRFIWPDTACATQNIMLAAEGLGLGSCWASISPKQVAEHEKVLCELLGLKSDLVLADLLLVGYPAQQVDYELALHQGNKIKRNIKEALLK